MIRVSLLLLVLASTVLLAGACGTEGASPTSSAPAALERRQGALHAMTEPARRVVQGARVPFLLLPAPWARVAVATSGPHFCALSAREGELTVSLHGTDTVHQALSAEETRAAAPPRESVRGVPARVLVNEGVRSVQWRERGVDWALEVECYRPETDPRCTEDAFVLELAERLEQGPR